MIQLPHDLVAVVYDSGAPGIGLIQGDFQITVWQRIPLRSSDSMTDDMYEVYKKHGGHKKKHPLDEVQGL